MLEARRSKGEWLRLFAFWRPPFSRARILTLGFVAGILILSGYYGIYLKSILGQSEWVETDGDGILQIRTRPYYWFEKNLDGAAAQRLAHLLEPAHWIDRRFRPELWIRGPETAPQHALSHPQ